MNQFFFILPPSSFILALETSPQGVAYQLGRRGEGAWRVAHASTPG
jgi:hypothetical protein